MKVGNMKAFNTALCILLVVGLVFQQAAASGIVTLGSPGMMSGIGVQRMEEKMAQALQGLGLKQSVPAAQQAVPAGESQLETPTNDTDELNISAAELINATDLNLTVNETALEFESKGVIIDESKLNPAESTESDILAEVSTINTSETDVKPESAESMVQEVSESSTEDMAQSNMTGSESESVNVSASNLTTIDANMTAINMSGKNLLSSNASTANLTLNATELNSTAINSSDSQSTNVPCKSCSNKSGQNVGGSTSAAVNGFWGIKSGQHTIGGTDIKSNTFLSGDFEVDKNVQFADKDY
jgi:hypothetical protein